MSLAEQFHDLFRGLERAHGFWQSGERTNTGKVKGKAKTVQDTVTDELWHRHLSGEIGIGIVPINDDSVCNWGAVDIDIYDGLDHEALEQQLHGIGAPLLVIRSKSGGAHLYLFMSEPAPARLIQQRLRECALALGQPKAEIFPKQVVIDGEHGIGNWINMPYQEAATTTRYCIHKGRALSAEEFLKLAEEYKITVETLKGLKLKAQELEEWSEAPPCIEFLVMSGFPEGSRNNALLSLGVYAKKRFPEGEWQEKVSQYNQKWMSGTWQEVNNVIRSVSKKSYSYKCSDVPLCNHCNKAECYKRRYGVTDGVVSKRKRKGEDEDAPCVLDEVDRPIKVFRPPVGSGDEPQWVVTIAGKKLDVSLDMWLDQRKFLREYTARFERLRLLVPEPKWQEIVNQLLSEAEVLELPPDAGPEGQLMLHLEAFLTGKGKAQDKNELLIGRPWTDAENYTGKGENLTWFRSKDFVKYCDQQHFRGYKEREMWAIFRRHGGKNYPFQLKGKCVAAWGFPAFAEQTEDLEPVEVPDEEATF